MYGVQVIWDLEDDLDGNVQHILEHDISMDEVEDVLLNPQNRVFVSKSSGRPIVFGYARTGKYMAVVFEEINEDPKLIYPVTAYEPDE